MEHNILGTLPTNLLPPKLGGVFGSLLVFFSKLIKREKIIWWNNIAYGF